MANMSDYLESGLLDHVFGPHTFAKPTTIAIALCSGIPQDSNTGATIPEVANANGYSRYVIGAPSYLAWTIPGLAGNGQIENASGIQMGPSTGAGWGWISGIAIVDSATHGAGNVLFHGALTTPKLNTLGDYMSISSGSLDLSLL